MTWIQALVSIVSVLLVALSSVIAFMVSRLYDTLDKKVDKEYFSLSIDTINHRLDIADNKLTDILTQTGTHKSL
jgi:hypothetical protein